MLPALILSPVLVGLPVVLANPARAPGYAHLAADTQGSPFGFIPAIVGKVLDYGHQIAQWTTGQSDRAIGEHHSIAIPMGEDYALPSSCRPHHPSHAPVVVNKTIYEALSSDAKFSKLFKLVNLNNATIDLLNSSSSNITFFAPPDSAFPKRRGRHHHSSSSAFDMKKDMFAEPMTLEDPSEFLLADMLDEVDSLDALNEDDDQKERRRKVLKYIVGAVLSYHVIPQPFDALALGQNSTHATNLTLPEGSLDGEPLRVRIGRGVFSPALTVNLFSRVVGPEVFTSNGIVHAVSLPLLPPPAIFTGQFGVPSVFSISTSALQRVGLTDEVDYGYVPPSDGEDKGSMVGASTVTFFAPSNRAFQRLPVRLRLFLFSPFGHRALKKLLQYHIVPSHAVHSDYLHNATDSVSMAQLGETHTTLPERAPASGHPENVMMAWAPRHRSQAVEVPLEVPLAGVSPLRASMRMPRKPEGRRLESLVQAEEWPGRRPSPPAVEYNVTITVPTLLKDRSHTIVVTKYATPKGVPHFPRPPTPGASRTQITVSGGRVTLADLPARNGAVHVIDSLLNPLREHKHHAEFDEASGNPNCYMDCGSCQSDWEDWEEWLPQWADEI